MEQRKTRHGIPMTEEEFKLWQGAFLIIAECIKALYNEKQGGNGERFNNNDKKYS